MTHMGITSAVMGVARPASPSAVSIGRYPKYGLSMRFSVVVTGANGPTSLGMWSSCSNLGLTIKPEEYRQGGNHEHSELLPGEISYPPITLERAVEPNSSAAVQKWLRSVVDDWINAEEGGSVKNSRKPLCSVVIKLYGAYGDQPLQEWKLRNVIPLAWSGPTLNASSEQIATEKLTLAHEGFSLGGASDSTTMPSATGDMGKLVLQAVDSPEEEVPFNYKPTQVVLGKTITVHNPQIVVKNQSTANVVESGKLSVSFGELRLEGRTEVQKAVKQLLDWVEPEAVAADGVTTTKNKRLRISLGPGGAGLPKQVVLKSVTVTYSRFAKDGTPIRAKVNLILEEHKEDKKADAGSAPGAPGSRQRSATVASLDNPAQRSTPAAALRLRA